MPDIEFSRCIAKIYVRSLSLIMQNLTVVDFIVLNVKVMILLEQHLRDILGIRALVKKRY